MMWFYCYQQFSQVSTSCPAWHVQHNALSMGYLGNHQWGAGSPELQYFEAEVDYWFSVDFSILTIFNFVFSPRKQSPYCHLSSHIDVYGLGEARGAVLPVKWMCNHNPFLEGYYPHFSALLHGRRRAEGGKWQWSGLPRCGIKPQVGEIALTLQALQITTLSRLNATAISKKTG